MQTTSTTCFSSSKIRSHCFCNKLHVPQMGFKQPLVVSNKIFGVTDNPSFFFGFKGYNLTHNTGHSIRAGFFSFCQSTAVFVRKFFFDRNGSFSKQVCDSQQRFQIISKSIFLAIHQGKSLLWQFFTTFLSISLSYPILSYPILSYPILSYPILSYTNLSYPLLILSLSYSTRSYPISLLSCPTYCIGVKNLRWDPISNKIPYILQIG